MTIYLVIARCQIVTPGRTENPAVPVAAVESLEEACIIAQADAGRREQLPGLNGPVVHDIYRAEIGSPLEPVLVLALAGGEIVYREGDPEPEQYEVGPRIVETWRNPDGSGGWRSTIPAVKKAIGECN